MAVKVDGQLGIRCHFSPSKWQRIKRRKPGSCGKVIFVPFSIPGRQALVWDCNVKWPCATTCKQNYRQRCPYGWLYKSDTRNCDAPVASATTLLWSRMPLCSNSVP